MLPPCLLHSVNLNSLLAELVADFRCLTVYTKGSAKLLLLTSITVTLSVWMLCVPILSGFLHRIILRGAASFHTIFSGSPLSNEFKEEPPLRLVRHGWSSALLLGTPTPGNRGFAESISMILFDAGTGLASDYGQ